MQHYCVTLEVQTNTTSEIKSDKTSENGTSLKINQELKFKYV